MLRRVRPGYQLLDRRGCLFAGSGEVFDDGHDAALAHPAIDTISTAEPEASAPEVFQAVLVREEVRPVPAFEDDSDPGDEAEGGETP